MPQVSVIIPTYNRAALVCKAIDSVINQTYQDYEIIVIDDGSTDATPDALAAYSEQVKYLRIPHSGNPASARNNGLSIAKGDYIAFLDSDDQWLPNKLERQVKLLNEDPEIGLTCSNALVRHHGKEKLDSYYLNPDLGFSGSVATRLLKQNFIITSTTVIRRVILEKTGLFCQLSDLIALEDYDLWLRISTLSKVCFLPEALAIYTEHPEQSLRFTRQSSQHLQGHLIIFNRLQKFVEEKNPKLEIQLDIFSELAFKYKKNLIKALWNERKLFQALNICLNIVFTHPGRIFRWLFGFR